MNLAGSSRTEPQQADDELKVVSDLRAEFGDRLPPQVYEVFDKAVGYHSQKKYALARYYYGTLYCIPTSKGQLNLLKYSRVLQHNVRLLK